MLNFAFKSARVYTRYNQVSVIKEAALTTIEALITADEETPNFIQEEEDGSFIISAETALDMLNGCFLELMFSNPFTNVVQVVHKKASELVQQFHSPEMDCVALAPSFVDEIDGLSADGDVATDTDDYVEALDDVPADIDIVRGSRKRKRNPENWAKNVRKRKKQCGQTNTSDNGELVSAKFPRERTCKCTVQKGFKCSEYQEEERVMVCSTYWQLADYQRKKDWLIKHAFEAPVARRRTNASNSARKGRSLHWYLPHDDGMNRRVCKSFFCNTIAIGKSAAPVMMALQNKSVIGAFDGADKRGKHKPWNKTSPLKIATVIDHINTIPKMASHYCRKDSKKDYIDPDLTVPKLYDLYKIWLCEKAGDNPDDAVSKIQ